MGNDGHVGDFGYDERGGGSRLSVRFDFLQNRRFSFRKTKK